MDNNLLNNEIHIAFIRPEIAFYMQTNDALDISRGILWETLKAYIRGQIISHSAQLTRTQREKRQKLTDQISEIDWQHAISPTPELLTKRISLLTEFNLLSTSETTKLINSSRHKHYECGEKIGKYLKIPNKSNGGCKINNGGSHGLWQYNKRSIRD